MLEHELDLLWTIFAKIYSRICVVYSGMRMLNIYCMWTEMWLIIAQYLQELAEIHTNCQKSRQTCSAGISACRLQNICNNLPIFMKYSYGNCILGVYTFYIRFGFVSIGFGQFHHCGTTKKPTKIVTHTKTHLKITRASFFASGQQRIDVN